MKIKKSISFRVFMPLGIVLVTFPLLFKEYIPIPYFVRGAMEVMGLGLEIVALLLQKRLQRGCSKTAGHYTE